MPIETPALSPTFTPTPVHPSVALLAELTGNNGPIYNLGWSPDGKTLLSGGYAQVNLWDVDTRSLLSTLSGNTDYVWNVAWSPDGKTVASDGVDRAVRLWDFPKRQSKLVLVDASMDTLEFLYSLAWSPDGTLLASGSSRGTITAWDVKTGLSAWFADRSQDITDQVEIISMDWSPDGDMLAVVGEYAQVHVWDPLSGDLLGYYKTGATPLWSIGWSPDGNTLAASSGRYEGTTSSGTIYLFAAP